MKMLQLQTGTWPSHVPQMVMKYRNCARQTSKNVAGADGTLIGSWISGALEPQALKANIDASTYQCCIKAYRIHECM